MNFWKVKNFFEKYKWKLFDFQIEKEPKYISKENFDILMKNERLKQLQKNSEMKKLDEVNISIFLMVVSLLNLYLLVLQ